MKERLYRQLLELVAVPSVTGTDGEIETARRLRDSLAGEAYFQAHPEHLRLAPGPDGLRHSLVALVRAARETDRTVLCIGHFDVVDTDVYGDLEDLAFDPPALEKALREKQLEGAVREDLDSGDWIFGRGTMDMKCGVLLELDMLRESARDTERFDCNLVVAAVFDEEGSNTGMTSAVPVLAELAEAEGVRYIAAVNTEPTDAGLPGAATPGYFPGTIGKALPLVYTVGQEAHGGSYYSGLSATFLQDCINDELEARPELAETGAGTVTIPPFLLHRQCRQREHYSVSIPHYSAAYYNIFTLGRSPAEILELFREAAVRGAAKALDRLHTSYRSLRDAGYRGEPQLPTEAPVLTYRELHAEAAANHPGDLRQAEAEWSAELAAGGADLREQCIGLVERLLAWRNRGPAVVVGLLPPFMPFRSSYGHTEAEVSLRRAAADTARYARDRFGRTVAEMPAFGGLCDLSYVGCDMTPAEQRSLQENLPGWGALYSLPLEAMERLHMPIVNMGPLGRDAHTWKERLERDYALGELPHLLRRLVDRLAAEDAG
ncbi:MAG: M20/M25/M40 family metallo-hydrolase [Synergistales bacterium]|nr:M20/M25/M40 family metallo-hydrolase [Synergistales bacterium]